MVETIEDQQLKEARLEVYFYRGGNLSTHEELILAANSPDLAIAKIIYLRASNECHRIRKGESSEFTFEELKHEQDKAHKLIRELNKKHGLCCYPD